MKQNSQKSSNRAIAIVLILVAVLSRRIFIRNLDMDYLLYIAAGLGVAIICFLIFRTVLKNKK
jgi:amino acid permease